MKRNLNKEQQDVWDKLNYVPEPVLTFTDLDINSMYAVMQSTVFSVNRIVPEGNGRVTLKVIKNR